MRNVGAVGSVVAICLLLLAGTATAASAGSQIVILKDHVNVDTVAAQHKTKYTATVERSFRHAVKGYAATLPDAKVAAVRADPSVLFVTEDETVSSPPEPTPRRCGNPSGPDQCVDHSIDRIDGDRSSTRSGDGFGSVNVNVAVIDSGVDPSHPDLNVAGTVGCARTKGAAVGWSGGHGTFVAGVIAARDNGIGVVGVVPGAPIWGVRVGDEKDRIRQSSLLCAVDWVTSTRTDSSPANDIQVANLSLSGTFRGDDGNCGLTRKDPLHLAICRSVGAGVTYVAAAGNATADFGLESPAAYDEVLTTTAMGDFDGRPGGLAPSDCFGQDLQRFGQFDDHFAVFSNFATSPADRAHTLSAPGVCIESTIPVEDGFSYGYSDGTSFASPLIAGTAALCIATGRCPGTPAQKMQKLIRDAAAYNQANPSYGFVGDPHRPISGKYYGWLIRAGLY